MAYEAIIYEIEDHIALITLNRPDALNALNEQLISELMDALKSAENDEKVRCVTRLSDFGRCVRWLAACLPACLAACLRTSAE